MTTNLTLHFTRQEATITSTGLANIPTPEEWQRIENTAYNMEIVRAILQRKPIRINSWFRSQAVNSRVGGTEKSEHRLGAAVDFTCAGYGTPLEICKTLVLYSHIANYNQLIYEGGWVHISFPPDGILGKREALTLRNKGYLKGIIP